MTHEAVVLVPGAGLAGYVEQLDEPYVPFRARCRCGFEARSRSAEETGELIETHLLLHPSRDVQLPSSLSWPRDDQGREVQ